MGGVESIPTDPSQRVGVISAGYSRTGTVSMSLALAKLVDGPVLHGGTQFFTRDDDYCATWVKAYQARNAGHKEETLKHIRKATAGFVAASDVPHFMPEMMELYPDAKVVLVRRDPQKWWNSIVGVMTHTAPWWLGVALAPIPGWRHLPTIASESSRTTLKFAGLTENTARPADLINRGGPHILEAYHDEVRSLVPEGQLLEMDLSEGWKPLCEFLDVPIPDEPFPKANDAKAADAYATKVLLKALGVWVGIFSAVSTTVYAGSWLWRNRLS